MNRVVGFDVTVLRQSVTLEGTKWAGTTKQWSIFEDSGYAANNTRHGQSPGLRAWP